MYVGIFLSGLFLGCILNNVAIKLVNKRRESLAKKEDTEVFEEILQCLKTNDKSRFGRRQVNNIYITVKTDSIGIVDILYMPERGDIAILKGAEVIKTAFLIDKKLNDDIIDLIKFKFKSDIEDVVNVFGMSMSKSDFEKNFGMKYTDFEKMMGQFQVLGNQLAGEQKGIVGDDIGPQLSVDEILDKIHSKGIKSLSTEEQEFLDKYSNGQRN